MFINPILKKFANFLTKTLMAILSFITWILYKVEKIRRLFQNTYLTFVAKFE